MAEVREEQVLSRAVHHWVGQRQSKVVHEVAMHIKMSTGRTKQLRVLQANMREMRKERIVHEREFAAAFGRQVGTGFSVGKFWCDFCKCYTLPERKHGISVPCQVYFSGEIGGSRPECREICEVSLADLCCQIQAVKIILGGFPMAAVSVDETYTVVCSISCNPMNE